MCTASRNLSSSSFRIPCVTILHRFSLCESVRSILNMNEVDRTRLNREIKPARLVVLWFNSSNVSLGGTSSALIKVWGIVLQIKNTMHNVTRAQEVTNYYGYKKQYVKEIFETNLWCATARERLMPVGQMSQNIKEYHNPTSEDETYLIGYGLNCGQRSLADMYGFVASPNTNEQSSKQMDTALTENCTFQFPETPLCIQIPVTIVQSVIANCLLLLTSNLLGLTSYYLADKQQRRAFLETRQSLEMKLVIEEQSAEQEYRFLRFYGTGAIIDREWTKENFELRHVLTRLTVHGFHHRICKTTAYHEPEDTCVCSLCENNYERYHIELCTKRTKSKERVVYECKHITNYLRARNMKTPLQGLYLQIPFIGTTTIRGHGDPEATLGKQSGKTTQKRETFVKAFEYLIKFLLDYIQELVYIKTGFSFYDILFRMTAAVLSPVTVLII
ncbi:hypothetical protein C0J52_26593 [Blattella germanica]|nr:hypothetical protein C0J52_26593 [Blattella germanica]